MQRFRILPSYLQIFLNSRKLNCITPVFTFTTFIVRDEIQVYNLECKQTTELNVNNSINKYVTKNISSMTSKEIEDLLQNLLHKRDLKEIMNIFYDCLNTNKKINECIIKKILETASKAGNVRLVVSMQNYCSKVTSDFYNRSGEFHHYVAKAQCMKGNSEKGLEILKYAYENHIELRSYYRKLFKELIHDSVLNRSEASVVAFKKYALLFGSKWNDNDPLVYLWYICWSSDWFCNQTLSNDLLELSRELREIVKERSFVFCIYFLNFHNEDAVIRLLQMLLKYKMMTEYRDVIQALYNYKLKKNDSAGCTEILKNCKTLGLKLPLSQDQCYKSIKMHIKRKGMDLKFKF